MLLIFIFTLVLVRVRRVLRLAKRALGLTKFFVSATLLTVSNKPELASLKLSELEPNIHY